MSTSKTRDRLVFAHANGFTGASYRSFLTPLESRFDVMPLDRLGHHPDYPVGPNWIRLRDELLTQIDRCQAPVIGVGHSMGGVLMAMAADVEPHHFRCVVVLDPPLMLGLDAWAMKAAKGLGLVDRVTPAGKSKGRRAIWPDRDAMGHYLRRRSLFRKFTDEALRDYIEGGTRILDDGRAALVFDPAVETEIFRHLPDHLHGLPKRLKVPLALLAGAESDLITPRRRRRLMRHGVRVDVVPGGHMFPMEYPDSTRRALLATLDALLEETS
ncbi:alpha/beta hydrolase [Litchfieldella qijiaojingensis]|uniref:Alpha/beta hydrolase n=1 Tax=Litchfieldella qijiaojingensis TaxID=980347 RepID=A0ABQ2YV29_9GAMM|nr:alpha/beta hydrolase [Halomonas qijiaojingensis]GGX96333.1 alpha/beta hydrolase [Halomonas qijiaojingensis]